VNPRRLYRCREDRQIAGVASGMAEYLGLDPTVVRILWILSVFFGGFTILLYIVLAFVVPLEPVAMPPIGAGLAGPAGSAGSADTSAEPTAADETATASGVGGAHLHAGAGAAHIHGGSGYPAGLVYGGPAHEHRPRGESRLGFGLGVLLVVFGSIALLGAILPGWIAAMTLGPAFVLALGVALVVVAARRPSPEA
jgi:phage shock protein C